MEENNKTDKNLFDDLLDGIVEATSKLFSEHLKGTLIALLLIILFLVFTQRERVVEFLPYEEAQVIKVLNGIETGLLSLCIAIVVFLFLRKVFYVLRIQRNYKYVQLLPHADDSLKKDDVLHLMRRLHGNHRRPLSRLFKGREWFSFIVYRGNADNAYYRFYLGAEELYLDSLKSQFKSAYTRVDFYDVDDLPVPAKKSVGGRLKLKSNSIKKSLPLSRYKSDHLPEILTVMEPDTWVQIGFSANNGYKLRKGIETLEKEIRKEKYSERSGSDQSDLKGLQHRFSGNEVAFDITLSVSTQFYPGVRMLKNLSTTIASVVDYSNKVKYKKKKNAVQWFPTSRPFRMVWTGSELANLIHFPDFKNDKMNSLSNSVIHASRGMELLEEGALDSPDGITIGEQYHPFQKNRDIRLTVGLLEKHFLCTGQNGSGKSSLVNNILRGLLLKSVQNEKSEGFSFIDPAGSTVEVVLNQLMKLEAEGYAVDWDKVHWVKFKDTDYPPAMNLLQKVPGDHDGEAVVSDVMSIIRENFQVAPQTERLLRNCIKALVLDPGETHTMLGVKPLINDEMFRMRIMSRIKNIPEALDVVDFFRYEAPDMMDQSKIPLFNRLDVFYSNMTLRRIFGQKDFGFPLREWMDKGHIVLYDFRGIGDNIGLIGSYLTYKYYREADSRDAEGDPLQHFLVIDEAQKLNHASVLPKIVQESRKKGLSLGTLTQAIGQLGTDFQDALREAQGTFFVCKQGNDGAKEAAETFKVSTSSSDKDKIYYSEATLKSLPSRVAAIKVEEPDRSSNKTIDRRVLVKSPPLDLYFKDGKLAPFENKNARAEAKRQTQEKGQELASRNGYQFKEIDKIIEFYLKGEEYTPKKQNIRVEKKAPIARQPKPVIPVETKENESAVSVEVEQETEQIHESNSEEKREEAANTNFSTGSIFSFLDKDEE